MASGTMPGDWKLPSRATPERKKGRVGPQANTIFCQFIGFKLAKTPLFFDQYTYPTPRRVPWLLGVFTAVLRRETSQKTARERAISAQAGKASRARGRAGAEGAEPGAARSVGRPMPKRRSSAVALIEQKAEARRLRGRAGPRPKEKASERRTPRGSIASLIRRPGAARRMERREERLDAFRLCLVGRSPPLCFPLERL